MLAGALACPVAATAANAGTPTESSGNPNNDQGADYQYSSTITAITPRVPGLTVQVQEFADRLLLTNRTGLPVTIYGYQGEPYARVLANGVAEQNARSPATYLNASFYGNVTVPPIANASAPPEWVVVDRTGTFEWHDHRIHWNSPLLPPAVKDKGKRTFIFGWNVPISIGSQHGAISGVLYWNPESSKASITVIILGVAIALGGLAFVLYVRRRRRRAGGAKAAGAAAGGGDEAW